MTTDVPEKPILPVETLLAELIGDQSSDYNDGDRPGYYGFKFDQEAGLLTVNYDPDEDAEHAPTKAVFKFVGAGPADQGEEG